MLGALLLAGVVLAPAADSALSIKPCEWPGVNGKARCGTFRVFEDREAKQGRTLELGFVILDATAPTHAPDAFVFINGGPGGASTNAAAGLAMMMGEVREKRDMLFLDLRGTGLSGALKCPLYGDPLDLDKVLGDYFPVAAVQECRKALEARADLTKYTTEASVDDLDDLRAALGTRNSISTAVPTAAAWRSCTCAVIPSTCAPLSCTASCPRRCSKTNRTK